MTDDTEPRGRQRAGSRKNSHRNGDDFRKDDNDTPISPAPKSARRRAAESTENINASAKSPISRSRSRADRTGEVRRKASKSEGIESSQTRAKSEGLERSQSRTRAEGLERSQSRTRNADETNNTRSRSRNREVEVRRGNDPKGRKVRGEGTRKRMEE
ncbi:hypothetical protein BC829DRAFT_127894 [Chytridium lagenaria]|nr:hypothetical protein BC829DRAFT_127894 [Chytridium lagenaria]